MFEAIIKLMDLALKAFGTKRAYHKDNKYKELYLLYVSMNDVISKSVKANEHLGSHSWVDTTSLYFKWLSEAVKKFVEQFQNCYAAIAIHDPKLSEQLSRCFYGEKSKWMWDFMQVFNAGEITGDGKKLISKALSLKCEMKRVKEYDISTENKRLELCRQGRDNVKKMRRVAEQLRRFIKNHVSVEQLL